MLDSAPLLGVTDTKVVSRFADKVLFVMQWDKTSRDTAVNALAHMREAKGHVAGVVLTPGRRAQACPVRLRRRRPVLRQVPEILRQLTARSAAKERTMRLYDFGFTFILVAAVCAGVAMVVAAQVG